MSSTASDITAHDIALRLEHRYPADKGWSVFNELRDCTGWGHSRTIDVWAMNTWPSKKMYVAVEIKVTLADYRRESPSKRAPFMAATNEFWYAAPRGIIPVEEIHEGCGLLETWGGKMRVTKAAVQRDKSAPDEAMWMAICRRAAERQKHMHNHYGGDAVAKILGKPMNYSNLMELCEKVGLRNYDSELTRTKSAHKLLLHERGERREWWEKWKSVVVAAQRLVGANAWRADPAEILRLLKAQEEINHTDKFAQQLRDAADLIDPPKEESDADESVRISAGG